jgi:hypothetical protein
MIYQPGPETLIAEVVTPADLRVFDMCPEGTGSVSPRADRCGLDQVSLEVAAVADSGLVDATVVSMPRLRVVLDVTGRQAVLDPGDVLCLRE